MIGGLDIRFRAGVDYAATPKCRSCQRHGRNNGQSRSQFAPTEQGLVSHFHANPFFCSHLSDIGKQDKYIRFTWTFEHKILSCSHGVLIARCFGGEATRQNPYPLLWTCLKESGLQAFFTRSSAANIPINMGLCKKLGLDEDFYSVSIPLGATINMNGGAVTITVMTMCVAYTLGIEVGFIPALLLSVVATLGACGASGVAGGSLLLVPMAHPLPDVRGLFCILT